MKEKEHHEKPQITLSPELNPKTSYIIFQFHTAPGFNTNP